MIGADDPILEWQAAYRLLGVAPYASSSTIRGQYRKLMKRWHPDLFIAGSSEQAEAARMSRLINEAFAKIENAPLRRYDDPQVPLTGADAGRFRPIPRKPFEDPPDPFRNMDRVEFLIKFGIGAVIGAFFGFGSLLRAYQYAYEPGLPGCMAIVAGFMLLFGLGSAKKGDKFWDVVFARPWWRRWW
jgi:curved DNA-binding protein CbpA